MDRRDVGTGLRGQQGKCCAAVRHWPPQAGEAKPVLAGLREFPLGLGDLLPVNSKKCEAGMRQRPTGNRRFSERKLIIGAPLGLDDGKPQRNWVKSCPSSAWRITGAISVRQMSSRCSRFGAAVGQRTGIGS